MFVRTAVRAFAAVAVMTAPAVAQSALGPYAPAAAKYKVTSNTKVAQTMMGQTQEFESSNNQVLSMSMAKAADALALTLTLDSASVTSTAPGAAPDVSALIGLKFAGTVAPNGKVTSGELTDKAGAVSKSPIGNGLRAFLPRLQLGATKGASWVDSSSSTTSQNGADVTTNTVVTYTFAGDTSVAGAKAWKITGASVGKVSGKGNMQGSDFTIEGDVKGLTTSVVSTAGILLGQSGDSDSNLTVTVEAAGLVIPITQKTTAKVDKLP
jgi:hypothetical protein